MKSSRFHFLLGLAAALVGAWSAPLSAQPPAPAPTEQKSAAPADPATAPPPAEPAAPIAPTAEQGTPAAAPAPVAVEQAAPAPAPAKKARRSRSGGPIFDVEGRHGDYVKIGSDHFVAKEIKVGHNMLTVMGDSTLEGTVGHDMVTVMGNAHVGGTVDGKSITIMGDVTIEGRVRSDVVVVMGNLTLGENARVDGDVFCKGGKIHGNRPGKVAGEVVSVGINDRIVFGDWDGMEEWARHGLLMGRPLAMGAHLGWLWVVTAFSLGFYFLLALAFPRGIRKCGDMLVQRPIATALSSVLGLLALPVVFVLLCVTIVGIPIAIICLPIAVVLAVLFGRAAIYAVVGRAICQDRLHPALALLVGALVFVMLYLVPILGLTLSLFVALIGFGSVLVAIFSPAVPAAATAGGATTAARTVSSGFTPPSAPPAPAATAEPAPAPIAPATVAATVVEPPPAPGATSTPLAWPTEATAFAAPPPADVPPAPEPPPASTTQSPGFGSASTASTASAAYTAPQALRPAPAAATAPAIAWETLPRAGFWLRMAALLIDLILVAMLCAGWAGPFMFILLAAYCAALWRLRGTTLGGIICGLKIVRVDAREVDWPVAIVRALGCFVSLAVAGLGFIWVAFDPEKQSWHDKIAGTIVVKSPKGLSLL